MENLEYFITSLKIIATVAIFFVWFVRYKNIKKEFVQYKLPKWLRDTVGILKISFSVMLHSSDYQIVLIGSLGITILMCGAVFTHIRMKSKFRKYIASVTMVLISSFILYFTLQSI